MIQKLFLKFGLPAVALAAMVVPAHATLVDYSTTGTITCAGCTGSGSASVTFGSLNLTYQPIVAGSVTASPSTQASAGSFKVTDTSSNFQAVNGTFSLTVNQTVPTIGGGHLDSGTLAGSIKSNGSTATITFSDTSLNLGGITYQLTGFSFGDSYVLVPPSTNNGITTLEMEVTSTLPEPTFMGLTALGFAGMGLVALRRRRRV